MSTTEPSAAYKIFHYYYRMYIPQHHLYSQEYLGLYGVPATGNRDVDKNFATSKVLVQITTAQMAEYISEGANLTFEEPKKSVEIYLNLKQHLNDLTDAANRAFAGEFSVPVEDIRKLEALATLVYPVARGYMEIEKPATGLFAGLQNLGRGKVNPYEAKEQPKALLPNEHKPITESIVKGLLAKRGL